MAAQQAKETAELKVREEKLAALQKMAEAWRKRRECWPKPAKIPQATVKSGEKEMVITILAINLFTPDIELTSSGKGILDNVGGLLNKYPDHKVIVRGHTDSVGSEGLNKTVSEKRAQKVREYLVIYQNVNPARIGATGLGPSQPVATNATEAGRALNRRVEIAVLTGE